MLSFFNDRTMLMLCSDPIFRAQEYLVVFSGNKRRGSRDCCYLRMEVFVLLSTRGIKSSGIHKAFFENENDNENVRRCPNAKK